MCTQIIVKLSDDAAINTDLTTVVRSTMDEFERMCPGPSPAGIRPIYVYSDVTKGPLVDSTSDTNVYNVLLTVEGRYYDQVVYQLAHELCHIFADPRRSNWLTECCCELASLVLLDRMSLTWNLTPPFPNWKDYATTFKKYAQERIQDMTMAVFSNERLPNGDELQKWLATVGTTLKSAPSDRPRNTIIALMLRPIFEESINNWSTLYFLGRASINPPTSLTDLDVNSDFEFERWEKATPQELKNVVRRISLIFMNLSIN